ncbi:nuclear transport factor 2 family protein [Burkholderia lata]|uniref:DUF4440 domain-containing protein n=1 Tax=Burkholderia lata (strain ATCC 17760 / DSM 23089 / LMG 22485 / NCIMB 9086 / R18194 / 383) TaxID=482957 RepID=Q39GB4_BURL3|nr:nuclear transport factor 2 family protein [Burkholderia lata]ABB08502.1 hypothetical protein Bcep18194_A4907 [Burkholderia lata]
MTTEPALQQLAAELEARRWNLILQGDAQTLSTLLSDDLLFVHSSGLSDSKQSYLSSIEAGAAVYHSADREIASVVPLGDAAFFVTGTVRMAVTLRGTPRTLHSVFTVVWRREEDTWRLALHQTTALPA